MNSSKAQHSWESFLRFYSDQNKGRKTRLGVFDRSGETVTDYWIEDGLPLDGIDIDPNRDLPTIEILLDGYSHSINGVRSLNAHYSYLLEDDGLDIVDRDGKTTVLRFELT